MQETVRQRASGSDGSSDRTRSDVERDLTRHRRELRTAVDRLHDASTHPFGLAESIAGRPLTYFLGALALGFWLGGGNDGVFQRRSSGGSDGNG